MRLLILYHAGFTYTPTIFHYLDAFRQHSVNKVEYFNIDQPCADVDFSGYDCLFVNFCVASVSRIKPPPYFSRLLPALCRYRGVKVAAIQDEYDFTDKLKGFFAEVGFDVILTNVPQEAVRQIYPEPWFDDVHFETVQTAYLAEDVVEAGRAALPLAERLIALGYRGRELPCRFGDLGWQKGEVGRRFKAVCEAHGVDCDIAVDEASRFQGEDWLDFVRSCRVMLGTPSGCNVFDFDGSLHASLVEQEKLIYRPGSVLFPDGPAAGRRVLKYEDVRDEVLAHDCGFDMGQVSARIFEAVASSTALALIRGNYSGVLRPDEHYVPIEPDYSNIDEVLDRILDIPVMQAMAARAYAHVVGEPANYYAGGLIERVDRLIAGVAVNGAAPDPGIGPGVPTTAVPMGIDPYLNAKLAEARIELKAADARMAEAMRLAAEGRLDVVKHPDGTYRVLKFDEPR